MLSIYFNCKLVASPAVSNSSDHHFFYPVVYPKSYDSLPISKFEILKKTLITYRVFKFNVAIFNLDLESLTDKKIIKKIIKNNIFAKKIIINFKRPNTIIDWKKDVKKIMKLIPKNEPVLVSMNHDHPYIDYNAKYFLNNINLIFKKNEKNFKKVYYYSHASEVTSWIFNPSDLKFKKYKSGLYISNKINHWLDSICVMTIETLDHIWKNIEYKKNYIGRFDWSGVKFSKLNLTAFASPREQFRHYDGYGHVSGIRILTQSDAFLRISEAKEDLQLTKFYYQKWLDTYLIALRDKLRRNFFTFLSKKDLFARFVEISLMSMDEVYFLPDLKEGFLNNKQYSIIKQKLRNHIYYMSNFLISEIYTEINISRNLRRKFFDLFIHKKLYYEFIILLRKYF